MTRIDHVLIGSRRIEPLREWLRDAHGFGITDGSPNPDGTASWIVPFDSGDIQYLELIVVHDERALLADEFGRLFLERTGEGPAFLNWAALVDDIRSAADRVRAVTEADPGLYEGESVRADGQRVPWAEAGFAHSWCFPAHPFFLRYGNWSARRSRVPGDLVAAGHDRTPRAISELSLRVDQKSLESWSGGPVPGTRITDPGPDGRERILSVTLDTDQGPIDLRLP
ncbi:VOC family protein [Nocardiopsis alba]|uniref:VOC family protein n=1 Tax=Nocardiopsis alba TaxID=53437 RepID=UPI0036680BDE